MMKVLVSGHGAGDVEAGVRAAVGSRPSHEQWLIAVVELQGSWVVHVLASPAPRLEGWSWCGPMHRIGRALREAVRDAGLDRLAAAAMGRVAVAS